jgi:hypothetical protein
MKLNSLKQTDKTSIHSLKKFVPFGMTNRTKNGHDRFKCLVSLTGSVQCDRPSFHHINNINYFKVPTDKF